MSDPRNLRLPALRRFALAISLLTVLGHTVLGFEQSWATPLVALLAAYGTEIALELLDAWRQGRAPRFAGRGSAGRQSRHSLLVGGGTAPIDFLLSPHITGLAVAMLLYPGERLLPVAFAAAVAIASKHLFRVRAGGGARHFFNPSNFGITATLLAFPTVGINQPYMFTEKLNEVGSWILPLVLVAAGSFLNTRFTKKMPLVAGWLGGFVAQALLRHAAFGNIVSASLLPLTGVAFLLFTFYMVTDPATTPSSARGQVAFGAAVAAAYGALVALHVVFGLFFALTLVCAARGALLWAAARVAARAATRKAAVRAEMPVGGAIGEPGV
jgi:hypothetical protein